MRPVGLVAAVIAIVVIGTASVLTYQHWPRAQVIATLGAPANVSPMSAYRDTAGLPLSVFAPASASPLQQIGIVVEKPLTKQQQYDKLKNGSASERMQAYQIVKGCLEPEAVWEANRQNGISIPRPNTVANCGDLSPGTTQNDEERRALLIPAVRAGAKGAFAALMQMEGPGGFMEYMGHPPIPEAQWDALMVEAKEAGRVTADPDTMEVHIARVTNNPNATQEDRARAIEYTVAAYVRRFDGQLPRPIDEFVKESPRVQALIKTLPPEVAQQAIAAGMAPRPKEFQK